MARFSVLSHETKSLFGVQGRIPALSPSPLETALGWPLLEFGIQGIEKVQAGFSSLTVRNSARRAGPGGS